jgi:predicted dehydrogenase/nucleoside-diphosphate-sugar epimerase
MPVKPSPRLAIIGCGSIVEFGLVPALRRIRWLPSVLVDTSPKRIDVIAGKIGPKRKDVIKASDWKSVAREFDAALVALPSALHGSIGIALAEGGKHVFMEKPLATTAEECFRMIAAAEKSSATLSVGLLRRYLSVARWTKALIGSGILGEIKRFEIREGRVLDTDTSSDALLEPSMAGGGVLMDTGPHTLDLLVWWLGDVQSVAYHDDSEGGVEADCALECRLASGGTGHIVLSRTRDLRNSIRVEGTRGFIEVHLYKNEILGGSPNALAFKGDGLDVTEIKPQFAAELFDTELDQFRKDAHRGAVIGVSARESPKSIEIIERCYRARKRLTYPWANTGFVTTPNNESMIRIFPYGSNVLVTGGTGFIGGRLVELLIQEHGARVRTIIRNVGRATRVARLPIEMMRGDLANPDDIDRAVRGVDYVFHCAFDTRSRSQNTEGLRNLIDACANHSVRRLVHVSTFSVYEPFPDGPLTEDTRDGNRSMVYVDMKLELEKIVFNVARERGVPTTIVQPSIVYGPFCKPWTIVPAESLIFNEVILPDRGEGLCNAVYIDDLTEGLVLAAVSTAAIGERFILSGPKPATWATFFDEFACALGTKPPIYWPRDRISKANHSVIRNIRGAFSDPRRVIKTIVSSNTGRATLQAGLDAMPGPLRTIVMNYYFGSGGRRAGGSLLPSPQALALYTSKAVAGCEKARRMLGYRPRFDFQGGMVLTRRYLRWAFEDLQQSVSPSRATASSTEMANRH